MTVRQGQAWVLRLEASRWKEYLAGKQPLDFSI